MQRPLARTRLRFVSRRDLVVTVLPLAVALGVATWAVLERWVPGLLDPGEAAPWAVVRNVVGREVGARRAVWGS